MANTVQEEDQKENAMGLADTDWLQSPPLSTPARPRGPPSRPLADNAAAVAAAANRENESTINDPAGVYSSLRFTIFTMRRAVIAVL